MAVPKRKTTPSKRNMRRSHHRAGTQLFAEDKKSGELRRPHHIDLSTGMYRGKQIIIKKAKKAGIEVEIVHSPATQIPVDTDIVVTHQGLAGVAKQSAPENAVLIQYLMFMNDPSLNKLIKDLAEGNTITST